MREHAFYQIQRHIAPHRLFTVQRLIPFATVIALLLLWQIVALLELYPPFIIPSPFAVVQKLVSVVWPNESSRLDFWLHVRTTLTEVLVGLTIGVSVGMILGYFIAKSRLLEDLLSPIIIAFQSTPVVAYAPLLIIWFGSGLTSKVFTVILIVFFPMLMNTVVGIRNVPQSLHHLMRVSRATRWQTFTKLEAPAAMPVLMSGLKMSVTLAVIGAVVGEFVSANAGLGFLMIVARNQYDTPLVLVTVLTMATIARLLYAAVSLLERRVLAWQTRAQQK